MKMKWIQKLRQIDIGISVIALVLLIAVTFAGVIFRYVFSKPFSLYRKFLKSSEIVYNRLEIKNDITKERRGLRHDVVYEVFCFGLG